MAKTKTESAKKNAYCLRNTDVSAHVNTKNHIPYLSWPYVVAKLKSIDPDSSYSVKQFPEINLRTGKQTGRKVNYCEGVNGEGTYVTVTATFKGQSHTETLPCYERVPETTVNSNGQLVKVVKHGYKGPYTPKVLSSRPHPNVTVVNNAIKRCYVKAVAMLTGLGVDLYISPHRYAKEHADGSSHSHQSRSRRPAQRNSSRPAPSQSAPAKPATINSNELSSLLTQISKINRIDSDIKVPQVAKYVAQMATNNQSLQMKNIPASQYSNVKKFLASKLNSLKTVSTSK